MNYTNRQDPDHQDKPEDWLKATLIFARTLSLLLETNQGIVVELKGDAKTDLETVEKVIVYKNETGQILVTECDSRLQDGQFFSILNSDDEQ
jgi:hypothetical protein